MKEMMIQHLWNRSRERKLLKLHRLSRTTCCN
ncbi:hypothetical protein LINPERHAP1_LOCUS37635 [Linum perenne]